MAIITSNFNPGNYCGTSYASRITGLSVGTVQSLVESGTFEAFKTRGGHRRILIKSVDTYMAKMGMKTPKNPPRLTRIMVIDDDLMVQEIIRTQIHSLEHRVDVFTYSSGIKALIDMTALEPDILITDMIMPGINGRELLASVRSNSTLKKCLCVAMSAMSLDELEADGGPPEGVIYVAKPISQNWISGFLSAAITERLRHSQD